MRILLLSLYYTPDIGPGALRADSIVKALNERDKNISIDVITSKPNRYSGLQNIEADSFNLYKNFSIKKISLPKHKNDMLSQSYGFLFFAWNTFRITRKQNYDLVVATSSRLMTAFLGALIAKRVNAKLYLDIRDLFADTMKNILSKSPLKIVLPLIKIIERFTFNAADKINVVSGGFVEYIKEIEPSIEPSEYTNGLDEEFLNKKFSYIRKSKIPKILYAGNIGKGQGLAEVIPRAAEAISDAAQFIIIGDGAQKADLELKIKTTGLVNVKLESPVKRTELFSKYKEADILFLHLNNFKAFEKVLPSKIFEYAATGKPILAGVNGFAAEFLRNNVPGVFIFEPQNLEQMILAFEDILKMSKRYDRSAFCKRYLRKNIMKKMAKDICSLSAN